MIAQQLRTYPTVSHDLKAALGVEPSVFRFSCSTPGVSPESNQATWPGPVSFGQKGKWTRDQHDLALSITLRLKTPKILFGDDGIACNNTRLGVALEWTSSSSDQRGISNVVEFDRHNNEVDCNFSLHFIPKQIRGRVQLNLNIYVVKPDDNPSGKELSRANTEGIFLGSIFEPCILDFDGEGSLFPITEFNDPKGPLWKLHYDTDDPDDTPFDAQTVRLEINTSHPDYKSYKGENDASQPTPLATHVFSSWLTLFFLRLKEQHGPEFLNGLYDSAASTVAPNSVSAAARYLLQTFPVKTENAAILSESICRFTHAAIMNRQKEAIHVSE